MNLLRKLGRILIGILREISDESAYKRHLASHRREHSGAEWRKFSKERMKQKYANAKCC